VEVPQTAWRVIALTCLKFRLQAIVSLGQVRDQQNTTQETNREKSCSVLRGKGDMASSLIMLS
jgi:hypothetical protein